jgi:hypothetical protein
LLVFVPLKLKLAPEIIPVPASVAPALTVTDPEPVAELLVFATSRVPALTVVPPP